MSAEILNFQGAKPISGMGSLSYLLVSFRCMLEEKNLSTRQLDSLPKKYLNEVIYSFTYRDISKEALILLVESIAIFLGLDPYASK